MYNAEMAKMVVTGGAGFIGSHIVDALVARGDDVHVVDNFAAGRFDERTNSRATYHEEDIREYDTLAPILEGAELVFHEAALPRVQFSIEHPLDTSSVNIMGTINVLRAAHLGGVKRLVYAASSSAYGDQAILPLSEDLPPMPKSPYGLQKHVGELLCRMWSGVYGLPTVSLSYFNVYGPRFDPEGAYALVIGKFLKQRVEGKRLTLTGDGTQTSDFTHVSDVVRANLLAAESPKVGKGEVINIGAGRQTSIKTLADMFGGEILYGPARIEAHDSVADNRKARELLGWEPKVILEDGIAALKKEAGI